MTRWRPAAAGVAALVAVLGAAVSARAEGWALVVTNNRSLDLERPDLRYADDDGVRFAELFGEVLGAGQVTLLTRFDPETRRMHPAASHLAGEPTRAALFEAVEAIAAAAAPDDEVWLVFAGHGDVDRGQGFLELLDGRLTARELDERVIAKLGGRPVHLLLDSCNSWFMLNPRKPGGRRWAADPARAAGLLERHPNVGAFISTSAEAVTWEWSELQSGIFSYQVRSGLRGAADADGDGAVSYRELAAFVDVAARDVRNDLFRPKVFARGPRGEGGRAVQRPAHARRLLRVGPEGARRLTLRDSQGARIMDLHKEHGTALLLMLPPDEEVVSIYERLPALGPDERPRMVQRNLYALGRLDLDALEAEPAGMAARGAPVFRDLFATPFGQSALEAWERAHEERDPETYGVTRQDGERLALHLETAAGFERERRTLGGGLSLLGAAGLAGLGGMALARDGEGGFGRATLLGLSFGGAALLAGAGAADLLLEGASERLARDFAARDLGGEAARAQAVVETERELEELAERYRVARRVAGWTALGLGGVAGAVSATQMGMHLEAGEAPGFVVYGNAVLAALSIGYGAWMLTGAQAPVERAWALYRRPVQWGVALGMTPDGEGGTAALTLRF